MDHAHDILLFAAVDGQAGMGRLQRLAEDILGLGIGIDHLDARAVQHDLFHGALMQVERAQKPVALFLAHTPLGMPKRERAHDLFMDGQHIGPRIDAHTEDRQDRAHHIAHNGHDRGHHRDDQRDRARHARRGAFGVVDRVSLGQNLGKDQHKRRHHQRGQRNAALAEKRGQKRRGK